MERSAANPKRERFDMAARHATQCSSVAARDGAVPASNEHLTYIHSFTHAHTLRPDTHKMIVIKVLLGAIAIASRAYAVGGFFEDHDHDAVGGFFEDHDHVTWQEHDDVEDDDYDFFDDKDAFGSEACVDSPNAPVGVLMYDAKDDGVFCYFCTTKGSVDFTSDIPSADTCVCSGGGACTVFSLE